MNAYASALERVLRPAVEAGEIPGATAVAGTASDRCPPVALGVRRSGGAAVTFDTRYDLASLTKVVGTLPSVLRLAGEGEVGLDDRLGRYFSNAGWFQSPSLADVTPRALLTHTAGLPSWAPLFARAPSRLTARAAVLQSEVPHPQGRVRYSDLGFMLAGMLVERVSGLRLDAFVHAHLAAPLGLDGLAYGPLRGAPVAATEDCGWRMRLLEGEVHDENAWVMDGVAGHAGLFGTADDLAGYAQAWLRRDARLAPPELLDQATTRHTPEDAPARGLGWVLSGPGGARLSHDDREPSVDWRGPHGFGHTGFTGTSLWIDPAAGTFAVLLTNRVHPHRAGGQAIGRIRRDLHRAVAEVAA
ncbi:MAG: serine hydrolase [Trueperaceae bacterium]|nr:serine hydrolase [Trueperaceae bacterium]